MYRVFVFRDDGTPCSEHQEFFFSHFLPGRDFFPDLVIGEEKKASMRRCHFSQGCQMPLIGAQQVPKLHQGSRALIRQQKRGSFCFTASRYFRHSVTLMSADRVTLRCSQITPGLKKR